MFFQGCAVVRSECVHLTRLMATVQDLHRKSLIWRAPHKKFSVAEIEDALMFCADDSWPCKAVVKYTDKNATIKVKTLSCVLSMLCLRMIL